MNFFILTLTMLATLFYSEKASSQIFKLEFTGDSSLNSTVTNLIKAEIQKIQDDINGDLPSASTPDRLMEGMSNSSVMAGKGIGTDYASGMKLFIIGAGVGVGADLAKNKDADTDISGVGVQPGIMMGTNLGWLSTNKILGLETNKLNIFANFMSYKHEQKTGDTDAEIQMQSMGMHLSYDWIRGSGSKLLRWGGVKITTGYEHNSTKLKFTSLINKSLNYTSSGYTYTSSIAANPSATIDVNTGTIPLNISSSVQFLYFLSLYAGLGADYNMGSATGKGNLNSGNSNVACTPNDGSAACPVSGSAGTVSATANINGTGDVSAFLYRGFAGVQFNLPYTRIFVQADKAFGTDLIGATAGVRFVY